MFNEKGTLRDLICKVKPKEAFMRKYCNPKKIQGLELQQIRTYGRQILENQQHRRLTRAQSHHGSEEEKRRRKILARKVENRPARYLQTHTLGM
uniref:Uncharacterized protein n=1 Tax=Hucho hucho TaxID=62062 RepID=A0A4W5PEW3_9TELE